MNCHPQPDLPSPTHFWSAPAATAFSALGAAPARPYRLSRLRPWPALAFSLIEVMIACGIFFMATFAILALVASTLRHARALQRGTVDAAMAASQVFQVFKTNKHPDLAISGDFGKTLPDYSWEAQSYEYDTNGLLQVDIVVNRRGNSKPVDAISILVYNSDVKTGLGGSPFRR